MKLTEAQFYRKRAIEAQVSERFEKLYSGYESDPESFPEKVKEWKNFCYKVAQRQKLVIPNPFAFENKRAQDTGEGSGIEVVISTKSKKPKQWQKVI